MKIVDATATAESEIASIHLYQNKLFCFILAQKKMKVFNYAFEFLCEFEHINFHSFWGISDDVIATVHPGKQVSFFDLMTGQKLKDIETKGFVPLQIRDGLLLGYLSHHGSNERIICSVSLVNGIEPYCTVNGVKPIWIYDDICFCCPCEDDRCLAVKIGLCNEVLNTFLPDYQRENPALGGYVAINRNNITGHNEYVVFHYHGTNKRNVCIVNLKTLAVHYSSFRGHILQKNGILYSIDTEYNNKLVVYTLENHEYTENPINIEFPKSPQTRIFEQYTQVKDHFLIFIAQVFGSSKKDFEVIIYNTQTNSIHERKFLPKVTPKGTSLFIEQTLLAEDNLYIVTQLGIVIHVTLEF
ncbi:MAG: hypothetical protein J0L99_15385 [Chitinophagales bacterium]|nr:hypothetical protein [Chitinophagales bacterium]